MRRLFFAARPDGCTSRALANAVTIAAGSLPGRPVEVADWHVTLSFLGPLDDARIEPLCRESAAIEFAPFELAFDRLEYWRRAKVFVAGASHGVSVATGRDLAETLMRLAQALAIKPDDKPWVPHLTLSRGVLPRGVLPSLTDGPLQLTPVTWSVDSFHLVESRLVDGRRYQTLASWPLQAL